MAERREDQLKRRRGAHRQREPATRGACGGNRLGHSAKGLLRTGKDGAAGLAVIFAVSGWSFLRWPGRIKSRWLRYPERSFLLKPVRRWTRSAAKSPGRERGR